MTFLDFWQIVANIITVFGLPLAIYTFVLEQSKERRQSSQITAEPCLILCRLCQLALEGGILSPSARSRPEKDFLNRRIRSDFSVDLAWMGSDNPSLVA